MRRIIISILVIGCLGLLAAGWYWRSGIVTVTQSIQQSVSPQPSVRFAVVGDNHGVNPIYQQIISDIADQPFAFLVNLADTTEQGKVEEFSAVKELESSLPFPVYHTVGNHDIKSDTSRNSFLQAFGHDRWYSVDIGQVHLIILDNADRKVGFVDQQLTWLERDLAAHPDSVNIVAYHRPFDLPLAAVLGDDETITSKKSNARLKKIITEAKVDQILTAHIHTYLPYTIGDIPAVISGGGGDPAQTILGGPKNNYFHYLDITVKGSKVNISPIRVTLWSAT